MKGIEGLPMKYILIILIAVIITGAVMSITTGFTKQITTTGTDTILAQNMTHYTNLCKNQKLTTTQVCAGWECPKYIVGDSYFTDTKNINTAC